MKKKSDEEATEVEVKQPEEKVEEAEVKAVEREPLSRGLLLDRDEVYWGRFIEGGKLDTEKLLEEGYIKAQIPYIASAMEELGWLKGKAKKKEKKEDDA